jgi:hypothetical protein
MVLLSMRTGVPLGIIARMTPRGDAAEAVSREKAAAAEESLKPSYFDFDKSFIRIFFKRAKAV